MIFLQFTKKLYNFVVIVYYINLALTKMITKFNIGKPSKHKEANENEQTGKQIKRTKEAKQRDNLGIISTTLQIYRNK